MTAEAQLMDRRPPVNASAPTLGEALAAKPSSLLLDHLAVVSEAAGGISALRRLVLELAIRGRLTSQGAAVVSNGDGPFALPDNWCWAGGREVFSFVTSGSRGWAQHYADDGPLFLRIGNLDYESTKLDLSTVQHVRPPKDAEGVRTRVEPGDILISITGDTGMVGLVPNGLGEAYINQHIALARPVSSVVPAYVALTLTAPSLLGRLQGAQRGIKNSLGLNDVRDLKFPLPPQNEQKRIVAKVAQLMALCDELEARQTKKRETATRLTKSALEALTTAETPEDFDRAWTLVHDEFPSLINATGAIAELRRTVVALALRGRLAAQDPSEGTAQDLLQRLDKQAQWSPEDPDAALPLPPSWQWVPLGKIITAGPKNGYSPKGVEFETPVKSLTLTATTSGRFDGQHFKYIDEEVPKDSELWLRDGDLLIQRGNTIDYVGVAAIYRGPANAFIYPDLMMKLRVSEAMDLEFVHMALNGPVARAFITSRASGTSSSMPKINQATVTAIPVPVPPLGEQRRIMSKVNELMELCDRLEEGIRAAEGLSRKFAEAAIQAVVATQ